MGVQSDDRGLFFPIEMYSNYINKTMHTDNLLDLLLPEIISFILKYLPEQELKNSRSINNIWEREANLEWRKRMEFLFGGIVQGNYTVKEYYSKLKECNLSKNYPEQLLKNLFLRELSPENAFKVLLDGLEVLALDEIVESLSSEQAEGALHDH